MRRYPALGVIGLLVLAGCSGSSSSAPEDAPGQSVAVTSTNSQCILATNKLPVGTHTFEVRNTGDRPTEVYIYAPSDKVISDKKDIAPDSTAKFTAKLARGYYQVACKPGQQGNGIREAITVG
ncbi:MAG: cupredoxin domain-containing protein [Acidimicrobiales bacterium]